MDVIVLNHILAGNVAEIQNFFQPSDENIPDILKGMFPPEYLDEVRRDMVVDQQQAVAFAIYLARLIVQSSMLMKPGIRELVSTAHMVAIEGRGMTGTQAKAYKLSYAALSTDAEGNEFPMHSEVSDDDGQ